MTEPLRMMAIFAHPDDESLGVGGVLAKYAAEGVETYLLTATRGQSGRYKGKREGEGYPGAEALGRIREQELRAAARELGVREVLVLDYVDGKLDQADPGGAAERIAIEIRRVRPQVVVTFPPDGGYGHPDHIAISQLALTASLIAADAGRALDGGRPPHAVAKFYFMSWPLSAQERYQSAFQPLSSTVDGVRREATAWPDWLITTEIDTRVHWERVWRAVRCHESQIDGYGKAQALSAEDHERLWGTQYFYRALSTVNGGRRRETDLFEGLRS